MLVVVHRGRDACLHSRTKASQILVAEPSFSMNASEPHGHHWQGWCCVTAGDVTLRESRAQRQGGPRGRTQDLDGRNLILTGTVRSALILTRRMSAAD